MFILFCSVASRPYLCNCRTGTSFSSLGCAAPAARKDAALTVRIIVLLNAASSSYNCHQELLHVPTSHFSSALPPPRCDPPPQSRTPASMDYKTRHYGGLENCFPFLTQWPLTVLQVKSSSGLRGIPRKKTFAIKEYCVSYKHISGAILWYV